LVIAVTVVMEARNPAVGRERPARSMLLRRNPPIP
jgi:hypothetical protein